jgi:hypothetical protein
MIEVQLYLNSEYLVKRRATQWHVCHNLPTPEFRTYVEHNGTRELECIWFCVSTRQFIYIAIRINMTIIISVLSAKFIHMDLKAYALFPDLRSNKMCLRTKRNKHDRRKETDRRNYNTTYHQIFLTWLPGTGISNVEGRKEGKLQFNEKLKYYIKILSLLSFAGISQRRTRFMLGWV